MCEIMPKAIPLAITLMFLFPLNSDKVIKHKYKKMVVMMLWLKVLCAKVMLYSIVVKNDRIPATIISASGSIDPIISVNI